MQKIVLIILFVFQLLNCTSRPKSPMQKSYPHAMITNDYGIVSESDLRFSYEEGNPNPLGGEITNFIYWICTKKENFRFNCHEMGPSDLIEHNADVEISIIDEKISYHFSGRRAIPFQGCLEWVKEWNKMLENDSHACVAGNHAMEEYHPDGKREFRFIYERFKTKDKCTSWFLDHCSNSLPE